MLAFLDTYSMYLLVVAGLLSVVPIIWINREIAGIRSRWEFALLCVMYSGFSVIAAMLFAHIESLMTIGIIANSGTISTYGFYFIGPVLMLAASQLMKWNMSGVLDVYAVGAIPTLFLLRVNCLRTGCCGGLPLFDTMFRWPSREMELIFYGIMFVVLWKKLRKKEIPGQLFPILMISYGCFRFINQWFRDDGIDGFHMSHGWSLLCAFIGLSVLLQLRAQAAKKARRKIKHK